MTSSVRAARAWVLVLTSAGSLMVALDQLVVATALTTIRRDLHATIATLEWTVNAYSLSFAVLLIAGAALGDRFGRRRTMITGLTVFALASAACALAPGTGFLIAARTIQGAGSALVMPSAMALLTSAFPPERRGLALGVFSSITGLAVAGGPVVGGAVTQGIAWPWIFWINVPIAAVVIPLARLRIRESAGTRTPFDFGGILLAGAGTLALVWGLIRATAVGWASPQTAAALVGGGALLAAFAAWELRSAHPMIPMSLFRRRAFSAGNLSMLLLQASLTSAVFFVAQYLQAVQHEGPLGAGLRLVPWTLALFIVAPVAGRLADRIGPRPLIVTGLALHAAGIGWMALNAAQGRPLGAWIAPMIVSGCGVSMTMPAAQSAVVGAVPPAALGQAAGAFNTVRQFGGALGVAVLAGIFAAAGGYATPRSFTAGLVPALWVAGGLAAAGALAGLAAPGRSRPGAARPEPAVTEPGLDKPGLDKVASDVT
jgi:EmrB/QacA subfamily drug resistance transporter